jgi:hypothetical protein
MVDDDVRILRRALSAQTSKLAKSKVFTSLLASDMKELLSDKVAGIKPFKTRSKKPTKRYVNILLSDLHYGADLDPEVAPLRFGSTEERRRTAAVAREVIEYKEHYRDHTELVVHLAGDIIQGRLHDPASAAPLAEQCTRAIHLLGTFLRRAVEHYPSVTVNCTPGNHGRIKDRHPDRAVEQKWDSFENIVYESLRLMFSEVKSISFNIPKTPFYEYSLFGMRGFITHGDTVLNPGYPGKSINVARLEQQILKLFSARGDYNLVGCGHVHVPSATQLPSTVLLTNGCLIPPDSYSLSIGLHSNVCVQQLWETVPGYMFGDHRMINVDANTDKDKTLDEIIPPDAK